MTRFAAMTGICASLLLGIGIAAAQDDHRNDRQDNAQPQSRQQERQDQARPEDRRNEMPESGSRRDTTPQSEGRQEQQPQSGDRRNQGPEGERRMEGQRPEDRQQDDRQQEGRQQHERQQRQGEQGREIYNGGRHDQVRPEGQTHGEEQARHEGHVENRRRISDPDFREHFGHEHRFRPGRMEVYEGYPRFSYGGYLFQLDQPWPEDWSYDSDDCYVDYIDGDYWLFNTRHAGMRILLTIVG